MKTKFSLPPFVQKLSQELIPSKRRLRSLVRDIEVRGLSATEANCFLNSAINSEGGFSYVRPGGTESEGVYTFLNYRFQRGKFASRKPYSRFFSDMVTPFSGVQYRDRFDLDYFCYKYSEAIFSCGLMGYGSFAPGTVGIARLRSEIGLPVTHFESIEPIRSLISGLEPWTISLRGKKVLVVHPFKKTIEAQFARREEVSGVREVLPSFHLSVIKPPISLGSEYGKGEPWKTSFQELVETVLQADFEVAIIGAGGFGAPLAHAVSAAGRKAIHTAGATQLMFGIRGKRWDRDSQLARVFDSTWVRPIEDDLSPEIKALDGTGAYH